MLARRHAVSCLRDSALTAPPVGAAHPPAFALSVRRHSHTSSETKIAQRDPVNPLFARAVAEKPPRRLAHRESHLHPLSRPWRLEHRHPIVPAGDGRISGPHWLGQDPVFSHGPSHIFRAPGLSGPIDSLLGPMLLPGQSGLFVGLPPPTHAKLLIGRFLLRTTFDRASIHFQCLPKDDSRSFSPRTSSQSERTVHAVEGHSLTLQPP